MEGFSFILNESPGMSINHLISLQNFKYTIEKKLQKLTYRKHSVQRAWRLRLIFHLNTVDVPT